MDWAVIKKNWMLLDFVGNSPEKNRTQANNLWSLDWLILWECLVRDWMRYMKDTRCSGLWNNVVFWDLCRDPKGDSQREQEWLWGDTLMAPTAYGEGVCLMFGKNFPPNQQLQQIKPRFSFFYFGNSYISAISQLYHTTFNNISVILWQSDLLG
jgi:hypothetical protein